MRSSGLLTIASVALSLVAVSAAAQSLADVAKREEQRRKDIKTPSKVLTNQDLAPGPAGAPASEQAGAPNGEAAPAGAGTDAAKGKDAKDATDRDGKASDGNSGDKETKEKQPVKDQKYWSGRLKALQDGLLRDQTFSDALQSRINALTRDFVNEADPVKQRAIAAEKQKALDELERLKKQIGDDKKALADFEDEAHRAGVPPGWLR